MKAKIESMQSSMINGDYSPGKYIKSIYYNNNFGNHKLYLPSLAKLFPFTERLIQTQQWMITQVFIYG
jgi:hypothetical protein